MLTLHHVATELVNKGHQVCYLFIMKFRNRCPQGGNGAKYERILLLVSRISVGRIRILKYDIFWLGVFGVF